MTGGFTESVVEEAALDWLRELGYAVAHGPEILPGEPGAEREKFEEAFLPTRLRAAIERLNPGIPAEALDEAYRKVIRIDTPLLVAPPPRPTSSTRCRSQSRRPLRPPWGTSGRALCGTRRAPARA